MNRSVARVWVIAPVVCFCLVCRQDVLDVAWVTHEGHPDITG